MIQKMGNGFLKNRAKGHIILLSGLVLLVALAVNNNIFFSRFLDAANASSMSHLPRNLILMISLFYRTFLSSLEAEKCV